jgi:hypothetical protein
MQAIKETIGVKAYKYKLTLVMEWSLGYPQDDCMPFKKGWACVAKRHEVI